MYFFTSFLDGNTQFDALREYEREEDADLVGSGWIEVRVRRIDHLTGLIHIENDGRRCKHMHHKKKKQETRRIEDERDQQQLCSSLEARPDHI